jgi:hypothetical protein
MLNLDVEAIDFLVCTKELEIGVHGKASYRCCPWTMSDLLTSITQ